MAIGPSQYKIYNTRYEKKVHVPEEDIYTLVIASLPRDLLYRILRKKKLSQMAGRKPSKLLFARLNDIGKERHITGQIE